MEEFDSAGFGHPPRSPIPTASREPLVEDETVAVARGLALSSSIVGGFYGLMALFVVLLGMFSLFAQSGVGVLCSLMVLMVEVGILGASAVFLFRGAASLRDLGRTDDGLEQLHLRGALGQFRNFFTLQAVLIIVGLLAGLAMFIVMGSMLGAGFSRF